MPQAPTSAWLPFVLLTIANWGLYGVFLHKGNALMGDPANGRMKAFLFVGLAYFLVAVLAPLALLLISKATWSFTGGGVTWSLIAGTVGAIGALGVLLAFGGGGVPSVVMSLIFAGAPIVNAVVAISMAGQWKQINAPFVAGILLAALGAYLVVTYKPGPGSHGPSKHAPPPAVETQSGQGG
jgi:hypothetical protein